MADKYYFPTIGCDPDTTCIEECKLHKGTMIGSVKCQDCEHCVEKGGDSEFFGPDWIKCRMLDDARG